MSIIDKALAANRTYAKNYNPTLGKRPAPKIAVVTCMDPRLSDLPGILGLPHSDLDVIRTGGPAVTEDVLGELVVSTRVLGTTEILLLNHTGCGFTTFTDDELNSKLSASTGDASPAPMRFFAYKDPEDPGADQESQIASLDRQRHPRARLHFRRGDRSAARSTANCTTACCLKESGLQNLQIPERSSKQFWRANDFAMKISG
jgi:carbonic anhydrase